MFSLLQSNRTLLTIDKGQKRWEKATTTGYENVRQYTHENLIPGLQRFSVLMSRLRGLSRFQESNVALGLETQELDQIFDTLNCLELLAHCILIYTNQELQQFQSFSTWLKSEIETQAINPMSAAADEHLERDIIPDYPKILDYVQGPMLNSRLYELLDLQINKERPTWDLVDEGSGLYEHYKSEIQKVRNDCVLEKQLPGLERLLAYLKVQCSEVFAKISAAQGRKTRLGDVLHVGDDIDYSDICIWPEVRKSYFLQNGAYMVQDNLSTSQSMNIFVATSQRSPNSNKSPTELKNDTNQKSSPHH